MWAEFCVIKIDGPGLVFIKAHQQRGGEHFPLDQTSEDVQLDKWPMPCWVSDYAQSLCRWQLANRIETGTIYVQAVFTSSYERQLDFASSLLTVVATITQTQLSTTLPSSFLQLERTHTQGHQHYLSSLADRLTRIRVVQPYAQIKRGLGVL